MKKKLIYICFIKENSTCFKYLRKIILEDMFLGLYGAPIIVIVMPTAPKDSAKDILSNGLGL